MNTHMSLPNQTNLAKNNEPQLPIQLPIQLVIQLARMGDLLQTKRLLLSLQNEGEVHLCVDKSLAEFAAFLYPFAHIHALQAHGGSFEQNEFLAANRDVFKKMQAIPFAAVYNLNYSGLNLALSTLFPAQIMHGHWLEAGQAIRSQWMDLAFRWSGERRVSPLNLMDFWGLMAPNPVAPSEVNPCATPKGGGLGVVLAGRMARRSIPADLLAKFINASAQRLAQQSKERAPAKENVLVKENALANASVSGSKTASIGAQELPNIYLLGSSQEQVVGKQIMRHLPAALLAKTQNLAGKTSLRQLAELVSSLDLLITPDTGSMHLAAFFGVPVEAFFLSSAWCYETGPYGLGHKVWQAIQPCLPCLEVRPCPYEVMCLNPFEQKEFLNLLAKGDLMRLNFPQGLLGLRSGFDDLGVTYNLDNPANQLPDFYKKEQDRRLILRNIIKDFLCTGPEQGIGPEQGTGAEKNNQVGPAYLNEDMPVKESVEQTQATDPFSIAQTAQMQEQIFKESDWMLPQRRLP